MQRIRISGKTCLSSHRGAFPAFYEAVYKKICEIPQEQYEDPELKLLREKACDAVGCNNAGVEGLLRAVSAFGTGVLGLFVYMVIAGSIHPVILLLLFGLSVIGALCNSLPDWYENKIRDENARDEMTMQYIDRLSDDAISGKDIRVFGLKNGSSGNMELQSKIPEDAMRRRIVSHLPENRWKPF